MLGELLQLLEYRGTTIRLLSGRSFVFPKNLFILGTMNSADRSIGRLDLALRRRFLWLELYPDAFALKTWLERPGNNPIKFDAASLVECNAILSNRGIPKEQHIGHALFMTQESESSDISLIGQDVPLTERHLKRIVRFSVLPYVKELFVTQFGQVDDGAMLAIEQQLFGWSRVWNPEQARAKLMILLGDIVCFEAGSSEDIPWTGPRMSLGGDIDSLELLSEQRLIDLKVNQALLRSGARIELGWSSFQVADDSSFVPKSLVLRSWSGSYT